MTSLVRLGARGRFPEDHVTRLMRSVVINEESGCWEWTKSLTMHGYGRIVTGSRVDGSRRYSLAHRVAYQAMVGPIPDGLVLDHLCRNPRCCNPEHLEPVTQAVNLLRGETFQARQSAQTHCLNGHEFTPENTANSSDGHRRCKACARRRAAESAARRRA